MQPSEINILIACEEQICNAFRSIGFNAFSCDIQECSGGNPQWYIVDDALNEAYSGKYHMMIAHPPCTYLSNAGIGYFNEDRYGEAARIRKQDREHAFTFFMNLFNAPVDYVCIENPVGYPNGKFRKPDQTIHPYFFGDPHKKRTCLWLRGLPVLHYDKTVKPPDPISIQYRKPSKYYKGGEVKRRYITDISGSGSTKKRSKTFPGIAKAISEQWGKFLIENL